MAIAVENTTIGSIFANSYTSARGEVSLQTGIDPILTLGICHCITERNPVAVITNNMHGSSRDFLYP